MRGGRPTPRSDPIPASHAHLADSEAAVPGEERGPGTAKRGPLIRTSAPPSLFEAPGFLFFFSEGVGGSGWWREGVRSVRAYGGRSKVLKSFDTTIDFYEFYSNY